MRALRFLALVAVAALFLFHARTSARQGTAPTLAIVQPELDAEVRGRVSLEARVEPSATRVRYVAFYADGLQVCRVETMPFACSWDAGPQRGSRNLRVVAELADGRRLVATRRSRGPEASGLVFSSSVDAVTVPVRVVDGKGRFVPGLTLESFRILEDGQPQDVQSVFADDVPANLLLALDMSASMQPRLADLKRAAAVFLDGVRPQDAVAVTAFNSGLFVLAPPGADARARRSALDRLRPWGSTALHDCLIRAVDLMKTRPTPRAVIAFTDGADVSSAATVDAVRHAFQANDVVLYLAVQGDSPEKNSPLQALAQVAEETGGGAWFASRMSDLRGRFEAIVADLSGRYVLSYVPRRAMGDGAWRALTVQVTGAAGRDYDIKARQGYLAVSRAAGAPQ